jgi:uracil-DNA glycosylase
MWDLSKLKSEWQPYFEEYIEDLIKIHDKVDEKDKLIFPKKKNVFRVFEKLDLSEIKVIILGQDCYHSHDTMENGLILPHATGLAFGISRKAKKIPPSLKNIIKLIYSNNPDNVKEKTFWKSVDVELKYLVQQGVLLMNCALTVESGNPNSHAKIWADFTDGLIHYISSNNKNIVFMLWGKFAQSKEKHIFGNHFILKADHPSPLAQGGKEPFSECDHFNKANEYLITNGKIEINWKN